MRIFYLLIRVELTVVQTHWPYISNTSRCQAYNYETFIESRRILKMTCMRARERTRIRFQIIAITLHLIKFSLKFRRQSLTHAE